MEISPIAPLLNPKEIKLTDRKGKERTYFLSEIPATYSREIVAQWTANALPKLGDYNVNEAMMFKILSYVGVLLPNGSTMRLVTRELIDSHVPDLLTLEMLEKEMAKYNWDFFLGEEYSDLKSRFFRIFNIWLTQILTDSLRQSLKREKPRSMN